MRLRALLVCAATACATTPPAPAVPNTPRPAPPPPPPVYAPTTADEIIQAQTKSYGRVTEAFAPVRGDLMSGNDRLVAAALVVVEAIGNRISETAGKCPSSDLDGSLCGLSNIDSLVNDIEGTLILLRRKGGCATVVAVERAAKQFDRVPRFRRNPKADLDRTLIPQVPPDDSLPTRVFVCGMLAVKDKVAACYARYQVPGTVMLNVVIGRNGAVTAAAATGVFASTPTGACVETAARTATFPPSQGLSTPFPFVLKPPAP